MNLEKTLDRIHKSVTGNRLLQIFTSFTRILLAIGFIPPSIPKITYQRFTLIPPTDPVGAYFEALYQTGFYYQFLGWGQLFAAVLLIIPRTSHFGALMFFPIIINIMVLTSSVGFKGTWLLTIFMFLACAYLVCWDYDRWKSVFFGKNTTGASLLKYEFAILPALFGFGSFLLFSFFAAFSIGGASFEKFKTIAFLSIAGAIFGLIVAIHHQFMRIGKTT